MRVFTFYEILLEDHKYEFELRFVSRAIRSSFLFKVVACTHARAFRCRLDDESG